MPAVAAAMAMMVAAAGSRPDPLPPVLADRRLLPLWEAAHRRLEATGGRLSGAVTLGGLGEEQRAAVDRLLGSRSRGRTVTVA
ncbi:MAG: hypothetical protein ACRDY3_05695, partial [Acidimicrobiales bacterium]